jgi:oxygen-independent coproporphyrinogen-3 oxidase
MAGRFGFAPASSEVADLESMGLIEILVGTDDDAEVIRGCIGPGLAPAGLMSYTRRRPTIRAVGTGRFVLNELVRRLSLKTQAVSPTVQQAATLRT